MEACTGVPHGISFRQRGIPADEVKITGLLGRPGSLQQAHTTQTKNIRARASRGGDTEAPASAGPIGILAVAGMSGQLLRVANTDGEGEPSDRGEGIYCL